MSRVLWNLFTHFVHCKVNDNGYTVKLVFLQLNVLFNEKKLSDCKLSQSTIIEPDRDKSHGLVQSPPPILRLRGGGFENDAQKQVYVHKMKLYPLGLRGGMRSNNNIGPVKIEPRRVPDAIGMCRDLLDDFDKLRNDYKKALGPCGLATCPMNFNVLEAQCRPICPEPLPAILCEESYCPPAKPPTPAMPQYSVGCEGEDEQTTDPFTPCMHNCGSLYGNKPCGRPECPFGTSTCKDLSECDDAYQKTTQNTSDVRMSSKDSAEAMKKSAIKCNRHICPYAEELPTVDEAKQVIKPIKSRRGCGSPYCPHSTPYPMEVSEVDIPRFPCKNPCPSTEELPPIHWDCPDPLPIGECSNPYCPLREKPPCGHCPISAKHCGYPGCPFADKETCPPTCPYIQSKPPKHLECTPSVCVLARTAEYRPTSARTRKGPAKVCNDRCPYNKDKTVKKSCGNPKCPYRTCADGDSNSMDSICSSPECPYRVERHRQEEREKKKEEKEKSSLRTLNNVEGVTPALGHLQTTSKSCDEVIRTQTISGLPRTTSFLPTTTNGMEPSTHNDVSSNTTKLTRQPSQRSTLLKMFKRSMLSFENAKKGNASAADSCRDEICLLMEKKMCKKCQRIAERGASVEFGSKSKMNKNKKSIKKKKKKKSFGYVYNKGTYYPGVNFGHKECNICSNRVPWDMGWMWNVQQPYFPLKLRKGWRPGAIGKTILKAVNARRKELGLLPRPQIKNPIPHIKRNIDGHTMTASRSRARMDEKTINLDPKPTLSVKKKDGIVYVTMNPLKDPKLMDEGEYPYIDCSPLQFRIIKKKDNAFKNCLCGTGDGNEDDMLSDKSSELDIEFTTPAGLMRPEMKNRQKNLVHIDTQYDEGDIPRDPEEEMPEVKKKKGKSEKKAKSKKSKK